MQTNNIMIRVLSKFDLFSYLIFDVCDKNERWKSVTNAAGFDSDKFCAGAIGKGKEKTAVPESWS